MKRVFQLGMLALGVLLLASCANGDLEKRVTDLERRVAALEGGNTTSSTLNKPTIQQASANTASSKPKEKPEGPLPEMTFEKEMHDFGTITEGDQVEHVFEFTNTGEAPLIISNAKSSCGCTVPDWTKEPVAPGEKGKLTVKYNSRGKKNQDNKVVRITANTWPEENRVTIRAFVEPKAEASTEGPLKQ
jgi:hypothetical protein